MAWHQTGNDLLLEAMMTHFLGLNELTIFYWIIFFKM